MTYDADAYSRALSEAQRNLKEGDKAAAREWAQVAANLAPDKEDAWLILAAVASPRASIAYLTHALEINPNSQRARKGMRWAVQRYRAESETAEPKYPLKPLIATPIRSEALIRQRVWLVPWIAGLAVFLLGLVAWFSAPAISGLFHGQQPMALAQMIDKATRTPTSAPSDTPTTTPTETPTFTPLPPATDTPTFTPLPTDTETPLPSPTSTETPEPIPTDTETPPEEAPEPTLGPDGKRNAPQVNASEHWIDVDLSQQRVFAYEGDQIVETFLVSTGTYLTPTVTGQYKIYVKYRAANMSGPGYFLPDVPYVMYFFESYGLHGTYWHHNFGTPMSHGCVNLRTKDAKWLFDWASVGTLVYVHR